MTTDHPLSLRPQGVLRCCAETWSQIAPPASMTKEGDTLRCNWCSDRLIVRDGEWELDRDFGGRDE